LEVVKDMEPEESPYTVRFTIDSYEGKLDVVYCADDAMPFLNMDLAYYYGGDKFDDPNEKYSDMVLPLMHHAVDLLLEQIRPKLHEALQELMTEVEEQTIRAFDGTLNEKSREGLFEFRKAAERQRKNRLGIKRGGDRRSKYDWNKEGEVESYAQKVEEVLPLCKLIAAKYRENVGDEGWMHALKHLAKFKELSTPYGHVSDRFLSRAADERLAPAARQAKGLALELARLELGIPQYEHETLMKRYKEGKKKLSSKST
jgi:hypothetical protein